MSVKLLLPITVRSDS